MKRIHIFLFIIISQIGVNLTFALAAMYAFTDYTVRDLYLKIYDKYQNKKEILQALDQFRSDDLFKTLERPPIPEINYQIVFVKSSEELSSQITEANKTKKPTEIVLWPGIYTIYETLYLQSDFLKIRSLDSDPKTVIIEAIEVGNIFRVAGNYIEIQSITLQNAKQHLVQVAGEENSSNFKIQNCILVNGYQQFLKISYDNKKPENYSKFGEISGNIFYFKSKLAPYYYTGGIDGHGVRHWLIKNNIFANFASPSDSVAEYAIHLWNNAAYNEITGNIILNSDRGIGLGMGKPKGHILIGHYGGSVTNNYIYNGRPLNQFSDVGISFESVVKAVMSGNYVFMNIPYQNSIEYRFPQTAENIIKNNNVNKRIQSRENGKAEAFGNNINLTEAEFKKSLFEYIENNPALSDKVDFIREIIND